MLTPFTFCSMSLSNFSEILTDIKIFSSMFNHFDRSSRRKENGSETPSSPCWLGFVKLLITDVTEEKVGSDFEDSRAM